MKQTTPPTPKQQAILEAIELHTRQHGIPPSYKELQKQLGYGSTASIWRFVKTLKEKGMLEETSGKWHSLKPSFEAKTEALASSHLLPVELIGHVLRERPPVLFPTSAPFSLPSALIGHKGGCYGLIIEDSSYIDLHLLPSDLIIVEPRIDIQPGELVLASCEETVIGYLFDEGNLLHFRKSPYSNKSLHENSRRVEAENTHIWGVIIATIRSPSFLSELRALKEG